MLGYFLKIPPLKKVLEKKKKATKFLQKTKFQTIIKPMIQNLQDELYQLEKNNQKVLDFVLTSNGS